MTKFRALTRNAVLLFASLCASANAGTPSFPTDDNKFDGDHLIFRTNAAGFVANTGNDKSEKCAPVTSQLAVRAEATDGTLTVRFFYILDESDAGKDAALQAALKQCPDKDRVRPYISYTINKKRLTEFDFRRSGVTFGGLVVPFKFRLGGERGITSSSTVAPYVGFRTAFQPFGLSFTPIASAGLGLVPVSNPATNKTETKNAFSIAAGFVMGSSKNDRFSSGFVLGRDLLSKADRALDPDVSKWWMSFYVGVSL